MSEPTQQDPEMQHPATPARTGACPFCTRKHLLRALGYAREVAEDPTREWERDNLLENLLLAEDHALALEDAELASGIRDVRHAAEEGVAVAERTASLYDRFKAKYFSASPDAPLPTSERIASAAELEESK
jgi:hypothetical protein